MSCLQKIAGLLTVSQQFSLCMLKPVCWMQCKLVEASCDQDQDTIPAALQNKMSFEVAVLCQHLPKAFTV